MYVHTFILFLFSIQSSLSERSFTVVLDSTKSMREELNVVKANIGQVVNAVNRSDFGNFVLVPFKDTVLEPPLRTQSPGEFISRLNSLTTSGGSDCPENSLAGIEAALRVSEKQSSIFVFTDAYAKDFENYRTVESLCKETHSQVVIFLSGFCVPSRTAPAPIGNVRVYYDLAKACSGAVFQFETIVDLRQAFRYMKELTSTDWTDVIPHEQFINFKQLSFSVDSFTTDFMVVVAGHFPNIEIMGSNSQTINLDPAVLQTRYSMVVRLPRLEVGEYTANIHGLGHVPLTVTFYKRSVVPFEFGFSTKSPRSIKETSRQPIAGWTNYLLINVESSIKLRSVEWLNLGESAKQILLLEQTPSGSYVSSVFVEPGKIFRFWIIGDDTTTQRKIKGSTKFLTPQLTVNASNTKPEAEILDTELGLVDFGANMTLACKVTGYPKPSIQWKDENGNELPSEDVLLEISSVYISYVNISIVAKNTTVTCNCENDEGSTSQSIDIFVNRTFTFDVIQKPADVSVEYNSEQYLYCQVDAYPEATIAWYLNDSMIDPDTNLRVSLEENALVIKKMSFEDIGVYECRASNDVETKQFPAAVMISGVEAPEIEEIDTEVVLKPGYSTEIECRILKGKPLPEIAWKYKTSDADDLKDLPDGALASEGKLRIRYVERNHGGVYKCIASNAMDEDSREFVLKIQYPPVIKNSERQTITVKEGDEVRLPCEVEAMPKATVRWEMSRDGTMVLFDRRHRTDEKYTHYFVALWSDSGIYHCVADNGIGRTEHTVIIDVHVSPYIETPKSKTIYTKVGGSVILVCNVLYGNPPPSTRWEFMAKDSTSSSLARHSSTGSLHLSNVSSNDEGSYLCIVENQIGTDRIKYNLIVQ